MKYLSENDIDAFFQDDSRATQTYKCIHCNYVVSLEAPGTHNRNHCPICLYSMHVDVRVGDRESDCGDEMKPVGRFNRPNGENIIIHQCTKCKKISNNRIAGDDDYELFTSLPSTPK